MGGIGSYVRQCAAMLARAGHEVHVFTFDLPDTARAAAPAGVHLHEVPDLATRVQRGTLDSALAAVINAGGEAVYRLALGWLLSGALRECHRDRPLDVVEASEVEALGLPLMLDEGFDVPVVTHLHCCTAISQAGNQMPIGQAENLIRAMEFSAVHLADALCARRKRLWRRPGSLRRFLMGFGIFLIRTFAAMKLFVRRGRMGRFCLWGGLSGSKGWELSRRR